MIEWIMILQIALTGQVVPIDVTSKQECLDAKARVEAGEKMTLTLKSGIGGVLVPVEKVLACVSKNGDGGGVS
jgi:hypothetical protein